MFSFSQVIGTFTGESKKRDLLEVIFNETPFYFCVRQSQQHNPVLPSNWGEVIQVSKGVNLFVAYLPIRKSATIIARIKDLDEEDIFNLSEVQSAVQKAIEESNAV